jgi:hypothetical protein
MPRRDVQQLPQKDKKPWTALDDGTLLDALSEYLSPNRVVLTFDEDLIVRNLVRTLKISRKCIMYIEASPKRSAEFGQYQEADFPLLKQLMLRLPPTTRWGWQHLSTENIVARFASEKGPTHTEPERAPPRRILRVRSQQHRRHHPRPRR